MSVIQMPKYPCPFCKRKESTQFCDFIIDFVWTTMKDERGRMIGLQHVTCDNQMCKECMKKVSVLEFCPKCNELYEHIQKNHVRMPGMLMWDTVHGKVES